MNDIAGIGEVLNSKVVEKVYDDAGSKLARQIGELGEDIAKTVRLILFPLQCTAELQDKLERTLVRVRNNVPSERCLKPLKPQLRIVGPIFENLKYMDEDTILYEMFEELLARSIDSERIGEAHPSFIYIISQISHDEAVILYELKKNDVELVWRIDEELGTGRRIDLE